MEVIRVKEEIEESTFAASISEEPTSQPSKIKSEIPIYGINNDHLYIKCELVINEEVHIKNEEDKGEMDLGFKGFSHDEDYNIICDYQSVDQIDSIEFTSPSEDKLTVLKTGEKPLKCGICDFESSWKGALQNHTRTHTGKKTEGKSNTKCCVYGCNSVRKRNHDLAYHSFPKPGKETVIVQDYNGVHKMDRKKAWEIKLKMGKKVSKWMQVCSLHFTKDDYYYAEWKGSRRLLPTAVPSQNLPVF